MKLICRVLLLYSLYVLGLQTSTAEAIATSKEKGYVGVEACASCHVREYSDWRGSHHQQAMQVASDDTVLGKFNDTQFTHAGVSSRFFREDHNFMVNTIGDDGNRHNYRISYTFGVYPLQQYLVEFPGGRLQALDIAWDSRPAKDGGQRWFRLNPEDKSEPGGVLHWTGPNLNWNYMCADCHSTNLEKNYSSKSRSYNTRWSEINVSCESCHGPGKAHIEWAHGSGSDDKGRNNKGLSVQLNERKNVHWKISGDTGLPVRSVPLSSSREIEACAVCHSRRSQIADDKNGGFFDNYMPSLLTDGLYHADGQVNDEVYVYGSFLQSKMYSKGVTCSDCHDPHKAELKLPGDAVCYQCHQQDKYAAPAHHHHAQDSAGSSCIECHMPAKTYMEVDPRHDHSFRIPRPDLSVKLGTPNACNNCHRDESPLWASTQIESWYGSQAKGFQDFAEAFHAARQQLPGSQDMLVAIAGNSKQPAIVKATALAYLEPPLTPGAIDAVEQALNDPNPLVRIGALSTLDGFALSDIAQLVFPLVEDDVKAVRIQAARLLAPMLQQKIAGGGVKLLKAVIQEYIDTQRFSAERPESQLNLGAVYSDIGQLGQAEAAYQQALVLQPKFVPAYVNLAQLYARTQQQAKAISLLEQGIQQVADSAALHHALGLALVRNKQSERALRELSRAAGLDSDNARFAYVYAIALHSAGETAKAINVLESNHGKHPGNIDTLMALVTINRDAGNPDEAWRYLEVLKKLLPNNPAITRLESQLSR